MRRNWADRACYFDDMPLLAYRMIKDHRWIREALRARFPVLCVDEYQDLGHALHELVLLLCFEGESGFSLLAMPTSQSMLSPAPILNFSKA
jgi:DNA helicase II / ATP-dependent DNA helicase PcrA